MYWAQACAPVEEYFREMLHGLFLESYTIILWLLHTTQWKLNSRVGEWYTCFGCECETKTGVARILVIFQDRHMFSYIIQMVSARAFH